MLVTLSDLMVNDDKFEVVVSPPRSHLFTLALKAQVIELHSYAVQKSITPCMLVTVNVYSSTSRFQTSFETKYYLWFVMSCLVVYLLLYVFYRQDSKQKKPASTKRPHDDDFEDAKKRQKPDDDLLGDLK